MIPSAGGDFRRRIGTDMNDIFSAIMQDVLSWVMGRTLDVLWSRGVAGWALKAMRALLDRLEAGERSKVRAGHARR